MLFIYMYEALERDHLGVKRKRREVEKPSLMERDLFARGNKQNPFMKREEQAKAPGFKSKDFVKEMLNAMKKVKRDS